MNNAKNKTVPISLRIPEKLHNEIMALVKETGYCKSEVIIGMLEKNTPIYITEGKQIASLLYEIKSKIFSSEQNESEILQVCDKINDVLFDIITKYLITEDIRNGNSEND